MYLIFTPEELFPSVSDGHKYKVGDIVELTGLEDSPEYNGTKAEITNIREDGQYGKCYYIKGEVNAVLNWTYEYRLTPVV